MRGHKIETGNKRTAGGREDVKPVMDDFSSVQVSQHQELRSLAPRVIDLDRECGEPPYFFLVPH